MAMAAQRGASRPAASLGVQLAVKKIAVQLRRPLLDRQLTHNEGRIVLSFLKEGGIGPNQIDALFAALRLEGLLAQFLQLAHPRWGMFIRDWLEEQGVPWSTVHAHYQYDVRDSLDFYAGFLAGMSMSLAEVPIMLAKLTAITIDGKLVEETTKFFDAIAELWSHTLKAVIEEAAENWSKEFEEHIYRLEWFKAGYKLGNTIANIVIFGKGAAKMVAALPRYIKMVPVAAKEMAAVVQRTAGMVVRTVEDAKILFSALSGTLYLLPDLRFSRLLPAILNPSELRQLLKGTNVRLLTKTGFELIYVESTKAGEGAVILRSGVLPSDFVPESVVLVRRNGKAVARIANPRSLAHAWKDMKDDIEIEKYLDAELKDPDIPPCPLDSDKSRALVERALKSADFAETAATLNTHLLYEKFVEVAQRRLNDVLKKQKATPSAKPSAANFGTLVESDMKPILEATMREYQHLIPYRNQSMKAILGAHLPPESRLLKMTVEAYVRENQMLAKHIGFEGNNLSRVLAADGKTLLGKLRVDFFVMDPFGHQGLLLDWTSFRNVQHFNKTLLYHAVVTEVFKNMRLPAGEMYHFGLTR
ncbi:MAG: hypothetical protein HZA69_08485 [Gammaproteobacteria bacterium]|nr:hypothetical protein [Gammaproteobacteria bacterium]